MKNIYQILEELSIDYKEYKHPAVFTCEEAEQYRIGVDGARLKNLFLRNKKGDIHFLLVTEATKNVDLKQLSALVQHRKLGFASPERLMQYLKLTPGSVSPFGLINDEKKEVRVVLDDALFSYDVLNFHPNINTATIQITPADLLRFLEWSGQEVRKIKL